MKLKTLAKSVLIDQRSGVDSASEQMGQIADDVGCLL